MIEIMWIEGPFREMLLYLPQLLIWRVDQRSVCLKGSDQYRCFAYYRPNTYKGTYKENRSGRKYNGDSWANVQVCPRSSAISSSVGWEQHLKAAVRCWGTQFIHIL